MERDYLLTNRAYDILKFIALIFLPAVGTLYFTLAGFWELPKADEVVGSITAIDAFLGALLGLSGRQYSRSDSRYDGVMEVSEQNSRLLHQLEITTPPEILGQQEAITFKVKKISPTPPEEH